VKWQKLNNHFIRAGLRLYYLRRSGFYALFYVDNFGFWQRHITERADQFTMHSAKIQAQKLIKRRLVGRERVEE